ncbi:MAG: cation:proton antiporter subunit C [Alphaproteobacteria bacterium]
MTFIFEHFNYAVVIVLMMIGLYIVFASRNLIKKLVGLSVFQTSVFLLYITIGKVAGGQPPILVGDHGSAGHGPEVIYSNPLPHVLILTAIVVGVATLAIGLALAVRIREVYGTVEEDEINKIDYAYNLEGTDA